MLFAAEIKAMQQPRLPRQPQTTEVVIPPIREHFCPLPRGPWPIEEKEVKGKRTDTL